MAKLLKKQKETFGKTWNKMSVKSHKFNPTRQPHSAPNAHCVRFSLNT